MERPKPLVPGMTRATVREHAWELFRDKLPERLWTLGDRVPPEKDFVNLMDPEAVA